MFQPSSSRGQYQHIDTAYPPPMNESRISSQRCQDCGTHALDENQRAVAPYERRLHPVLGKWQIFFIGLTVVIGTGVFNDYGKVAKTAGPGGLLIAFVIVAIISICAMNGLSEMIQLFPTVNPIVEFVHHFVDHDLARVVGVGYWFAYAVFFPLQLCVVASYLQLYTGTSVGWVACKVVLFYALVPLVLWLLNINSIKFFGTLETVSGALKSAVLLAVIAILLYIAGRSPAGRNIGQGVISRIEPNDWPGSAIGLSVNFIVFSFVGVESLAVTSFEARDIMSIRWPSQRLTIIIALIYLACALAQCLSIDWRNEIHVGTVLEPTKTPFTLQDDPTKTSTSPPIVAALEDSKGQLARAMNGMLMFCSLSAANSCLYVASRMLYGLAFVNNRGKRSYWSWLAKLNEHGAPQNAVTVSTVFLWIAYTQIIVTGQEERLLTWFNNAGSYCVLFTWAAISLAYIRYHWWFKGFRRGVLSEARYARFDRKSESKTCSTPLAAVQPVLAYIALFGCVGIIFGMASSAMWTSHVTTREYFQFYTMSTLLPLAWIGLKVFGLYQKVRETGSVKEGFRECRLWVQLTDRREDLVLTIENLVEVLKQPLRRMPDEQANRHEGIEMHRTVGTSSAIFGHPPPSRVNTARSLEQAFPATDSDE